MKYDKQNGDLPTGARSVSIDEMMPIIRESLAAGGNAELPVRGVSMLPTFKEGRDSVILSPIQRIRKGDVALYQRKNGSYVLHRIAAAGETYTCIGDAQFVFETGIAPSQLIAVVTAFRRKGRLIRVSNLAYRFYSALWSAFRPLRHFSKRALRKLCRMLGRKK